MCQNAVLCGNGLKNHSWPVLSCKARSIMALKKKIPTVEIASLAISV